MPDSTVLLVDDEPNILNALMRLLRRDGYKVFTAKSGAEGLNILADNNVDIIITDQRMPEMSGTEFLSLVREAYPDTVRIVLSGYTDFNSITDAVNRGAIYKFLTKPWDDEQLLETVRQAVAQSARQQAGRLTPAGEELGRRSAEPDLAVEPALQFSEVVLEHLPQGVLAVDAEGVIRVANSTIHALLGVEAATLPGEMAASVLPRQLVELCEMVGEGRRSGRLKLASGEVTFYCSGIHDKKTYRSRVLVLLPVDGDVWQGRRQ